MSPAERWTRIERLFGTLFEMPEEERRRALADVEDGDLRDELEALLSAHEQLTSHDGGFLDVLDAQRACAILDDAEGGGEPPSIDRYRIVRRLGRGGMGVVYQAHDPRLERPLALKLLPPRLSSDPGAVRRLRDEARAASALDHPNIETVYEIGETADGALFVAMAYYDGETLRRRISRARLTVLEAVDLGVQLAEGLSAAHGCGIVHRDIKPENLLLTRAGLLKIVDFGLAGIASESRASGGTAPGTRAYMSPEQSRGEELDRRTDIWSAGVVLYEMLAGRRPFGGEGEALLHAIRQAGAPPLRTLRPDVPSRLAAVVERCLEKDPQLRFDSTSALAKELRAVSGGPAAEITPGRRRLTRVLVPLALACSVLLGLAGLRAVLSDGRSSPPAFAPAGGAAPGIAVLPFEVKGDGLDIWREGMVDLLSTNLDGVAGLRAIDSRTVLARWREGVGESGASDLATALEVARGTGARWAVMGSVVSAGSGVRLGARIHSLADGSSLASLQVEGPTDSLFALVDALSIDVLAAIWQGKEQPRVRLDLARITTASLPALKAYLEGEGFLRRADFEKAIGAYERAIAADSTFAFALYHLGLARAWSTEGDADDLRLLEENFRRALRHGGRLPEREARLLRAAQEYHTAGGSVAAVHRLRDATRIYPDDADAWFLLGESSYHAGAQALVSRGESERALRNAVELDPGFALSYTHLVDNAFTYRPDSARAAELIETYHRLAPNSPVVRDHHVAFALAFGDSAHRRQAYAALDTLPLRTLATLSWGPLDHPRFWAQRAAVLERRSLPNDPVGRLMTLQLFETRLSQGKLRAALSLLDDPLMYAGLRAAGFYRIHSAGLPLPDGALDEALAQRPADGPAADIGKTLIWFYAGAHAADQARWTDHATADGRLRAHADRLLAEGDSSDSRFVRGAVLALQGRGLWRRGERERALPLLVAGQRQATWPGSASRETVNDTIRWWLGELLLEMGKPQEAALYFESFWNDPFAADRLGPIYERLGDPTRAREAYALVASAWQDTDPEFQPRARAARAALQRRARPPPTSARST